MEIGTLGLMKLEERLIEQGLAQTSRSYALLGVDLYEAKAGTAAADMLDAYCANSKARREGNRDVPLSAYTALANMPEMLAQLRWIEQEKAK